MEKVKNIGQDKLISICIPTFNRIEVLKELLDCLKAQSRPELEIIVSDNGNDATDQLVSNYSIIYSRNDSNIGFDANVLRTIELATGKYCWLLNDSSRLKDGAIDYIIEAIKTKCDVYITKANYEGDVIYENGSAAICQEGAFGGKLNRVILLRNKAVCTKSIPRTGPGFIHMELALRMAADGRIGFVKDLQSQPRHSYSSNWAQIDGNVFFAYINLFDIYSSTIEWGYDTEVIEKVKNKLVLGFPLTLVSARLYGLKISWLNFKYLFRFKTVLPISILIFLTPRFVLKLLKLLQIRLRYLTQ